MKTAIELIADERRRRDDTVRCWACSGSGDVKDKKTGEMRFCRACMGKGRVMTTNKKKNEH